MGSDDQRRDDKKKPAIEDWLAAQLGEVDDAPLDSEEVSFTEADEDELVAESPPPSAAPEAPEAPEVDDAPSVPDLDWDPAVSDELSGKRRRTSHEPAPPRALSADDLVGNELGLWARDGDTQPLPPAPDPWSSRSSLEGGLREPPPEGEAPTRPTKLSAEPPPDHLDESHIEEPDEDTLPDPDLIAKLESRMPGRAFDEVFPDPPAGEGQRETTMALLDGVSAKRDETATGPFELLEIADEAAPNNIHNEPTHINGPPAGFAGYDASLDEMPTVISKPPPQVQEAGTPTAIGRRGDSDDDDDEGYPASVLAWTASTVGVLLFGAVAIVFALAAAQYLDLVDTELLDLTQERHISKHIHKNIGDLIPIKCNWDTLVLDLD